MSDLKKPESKKRDLFISDRICQSSVIDAIKEKCDMIIDDDSNVVECTEEEDDPNQISLIEVVLLPTWFQTAVAA